MDAGGALAREARARSVAGTAGTETLDHCPPLHPSFGLEITGLDVTTWDAATIHRCKIALARHGVLLFRNQFLTEEQFADVSRQIGNGTLELSARSVSHSKTCPHVSQLTNFTDDAGDAIGFGDNSTDYWHSDQEFRVNPASVAGLHCKVPSPIGGETSFASTVIDKLDIAPATRARIRDLWSTRVPASTHDHVDHIEVCHPVVLISPFDGRELLYHSENTLRFIGLEDDEGHALKKELLEAILASTNIYSHVWRPGDLILYDNTQVVHRREAFEGKRWLQGTKIFAPRDLFAYPIGAPFDPQDSLPLSDKESNHHG